MGGVGSDNSTFLSVLWTSLAVLSGSPPKIDVTFAVRSHLGRLIEFFAPRIDFLC